MFIFWCFFYVLVTFFCVKLRSIRPHNKMSGRWVRTIRVKRWKKSIFFNLIIVFSFFYWLTFPYFESCILTWGNKFYFFVITIKSILLLKLVTLMQIDCSFFWCFGIRLFNNWIDCFKKFVQWLVELYSRFKEEDNSSDDACMRRNR